METTTVEDRRQVEFEGSEEFPDLYDLGRLPLWNLADYGSVNTRDPGVLEKD